MPTLTKAQPTAPVEPLDLASLTHLNAHPRLRPLIERRSQLRRELTEISEQVKLLQKDLRDLPTEDSFTVMTQRRTLLDQVAALEREGAWKKEEQRPLWAEIETIETALRGEVLPVLTQESRAVLEAYVTALEQLGTAQQAYRDCCIRNQQLVMSSILPLRLLNGTLPSWLAMARQYLAEI